MSRLGRSFGYAFKGLGETIKTQPNMQIHLIVTVLVVLAGLIVGLAAWEWAIILLAIALVLAAETFNTALEYLADAVSSEPHPLVGKAKDAAAGAVVVAALLAAIIGLVIFTAHII